MNGAAVLKAKSARNISTQKLLPLSNWSETFQPKSATVNVAAAPIHDVARVRGKASVSPLRKSPLQSECGEVIAYEKTPARNLACNIYTRSHT